MSNVMLFGVLRMPYELAMSNELSRRQFYDRAQQATDRIADLEAALAKAQEDGRRLELVATFGSAVRKANNSRKNWIVWGMALPNSGGRLIDNLRAAIDAALHETAAPTPDSEKPQAGWMITEVE